MAGNGFTAISFFVFLLLSFVPIVLAKLEPSEYYIKPTQFMEAMCPGQPCMTLNRYVQNSTRYLHSHSSLKFLPGSHQMDQPLVVQGVENVSFAGVDIAIGSDISPVIEFDCHCCPLQDFSFSGCAMFAIHNSSRILFHKLGFVRNCNDQACSAVVLNIENSSHVSITSTIFSIQKATYFTHAVVVSQSVHVAIHHVITWSISHPVEIFKASNVTIFDLITRTSSIPMTRCQNSDLDSIVSVSMCTDIIINKCTLVQPSCRGVMLHSSYNSTISNIYISDKEYQGIFLKNANSTKISNITAAYLKRHGLHLLNTWNTVITQVTLRGMPGNALYLDRTSNTSISFMNISKCYGNGLSIENAFFTEVINITLTNIFAAKSFQASDTKFINISMRHSKLFSMYRCEVLYIENFIFVGDNYDWSDVLWTSGILIAFSQKVYLYQLAFSITSSKSALISSETGIDVPHLPAAFELYKSNVNISNSRFYNNKISALKTINSKIVLSGVVTFEGNSALKGAAMMVINSTMLITSNSTLMYENNSAVVSGGAIEAWDTPMYHYSRAKRSSVCPVTIFEFHHSAKIVFANNSAGSGGDNIYGGSLGHFCWPAESKNFFTLYDMMKEAGQTSMSSVASDPSRVCLCNDMGIPQCTIVFDQSDHLVYPGQTLSFSAVVVGQLFGTVSGSVFAQFLPTPSTSSDIRLAPFQETQVVSQHHCNKLEFTIYSLPLRNRTVLTLNAINRKTTELVNATIVSQALSRYRHFTKNRGSFPKNLLYFPVFVYITILSCPPGFAITAEPHACDCSPHLKGITCDIQTQTFHRNGLIWVGPINNENNSIVDVLVGSWCPHNYCSTKHLSVHLDDPDIQCSYNHSGVLCGGCQHGLSLALGSTQCLHCSNNYLALLLPFALAGIILVFFLKVLNLTISDGTLNGLILYANVVKANEYLFLLEKQMQVSPIGIFISWFNLDLGIETCFFISLNANKKTWLQFAFPLYVWLIAGLIIVLAKYNYRVARIIGNNSVPVLATLFLLSYAKFVNTIIRALSYSVLASENHTVLVWGADGNVKYLNSSHAPLFAVAIFTLVFLSVPYTFLLLLAPFLTKCRHRLVTRMLLKLKPFLDAHYGPNKDKLRYWFGLLLLVRAAIMLVSALVSNNPSTIVLIVSVVAMILTVFSAVGVYRKSAVSLFETAIFLNLTLLCVTKLYTLTISDGRIIIGSYLFISLVMIQFLGLLGYKTVIFLKLHFSKKTRKEETETMWRFERSDSLRNIVRCVPSGGPAPGPGAEYCQFQERAL